MCSEIDFLAGNSMSFHLGGQSLGQQSLTVRPLLDISEFHAPYDFKVLIKLLKAVLKDPFGCRQRASNFLFSTFLLVSLYMDAAIRVPF